MNTGFARHPGKFAKYLRRYLEPKLWTLIEETYADAGYGNTWAALLAMYNLFRTIAVRVAAHFDLTYPAGHV